MLYKKNTPFWWIYFYGAIIIMLATIGKWAGHWSWIALWVTFAILVIGTSIHIFRYYRQKRLLKNPFEVTYLIPRSEYPYAKFLGADAEQKYSTELTVGVGHYRIMYQMLPQTDVTIGDILLSFNGAEQNKPKDFGADNPFIVEEIITKRGTKYRDWWGIVHSVIEKPLYKAHECRVMGFRIETYGVWQGETVLYFPLQEAAVIQKNFKLTITLNESENQIPFLKGWSDDKAN